ncbi:MAG: cytochrome P450, partial [Alphaproteobacteria bacterium]
WFPFAGGPRACLGLRFALMEAQIILAMIARRYELELMPGETMTPEPMVTLRPRSGTRMRLIRRA